MSAIDDRFITQTFSISNHPIRNMKEQQKLQYVLGLGGLVYYLSKGDNKAKLILEVWCLSILGYVPNDIWNHPSDSSKSKNNLQIVSKLFVLFPFRQSFLFDCFYLLERLNPQLIHKVYTLLSDSDFITKSELMNLYEYFKGKGEAIGVPDELKRHRYLNCSFSKEPLKRILMVGTVSAGKSTLINAIVGARLNKIRTTACTSRLSYIYNKPNEDGLTINFSNDKFVYTTDMELVNSEIFNLAAFHFNSSLANEHICLIDTPGENNSINLRHGEITRTTIKRNLYDIIVFVANSRYFAINDESSLLEYTIKNSRKPIVFVLNQLDSFNPDNDSIKKIMKDFYLLLTKNKLRSPIIVPTSALLGMFVKLGNEGLRKTEKLNYVELMNRFQDPYYNLESYYDGRSSSSTDILSKSGILNLENILYSL